MGIGLVRAGGFASGAAIRPTLDLTICALCGRLAYATDWFHAASRQVVCRTRLPDRGPREPALLAHNARTVTCVLGERRELRPPGIARSPAT